MPISQNLMLALLSMDAYNRGYGAGIADGEGPTDANGNDADGLGEAGKQIGTATVRDFDLPEGSEAAGFYAVAYEWNNKTVISYRGTDNVDFLTTQAGGSDFWNGWTIGAGVPAASQAGLASRNRAMASAQRATPVLRGSLREHLRMRVERAPCLHLRMRVEQATLLAPQDASGAGALLAPRGEPFQARCARSSG